MYLNRGPVDRVASLTCVHCTPLPPDVHASLSVLFCFVNPLLMLDEAVSLAVAVCMLVFGDNRTMGPDQLAICHAWHTQCWQYAVGRPANIQRRALNISRRHRRGFLNIPHGTKVVTTARAPKQAYPKAKKELHTTSGDVPPPMLPKVKQKAAWSLLAVLSKQSRWGKRLNRVGRV